jgi:glycosyltransferase involved in cell wall biosynthesis
MTHVGRGRTRVVIASRLFPPEPGAAAFRLGWLARTLDEEGARVDVVTTRPPAVARSSTPVGGRIAVFRWPVLRDKGGNVRGYLQFASYDGPLLLRLLFHRCDVIISEPPPTTGAVVRVVAALRRVPYIYYAADVSSSAAAGIGLHPVALAVLRRLESWAMSGAAAVLTVSAGVSEEVRALGVAGERVVEVGTGVDTTAFHPSPTPADQVPTLVYAGTMSEIHGAEVFVRAFGTVATEFPAARLVMLGQGTERDHLEALADRVAPGRVTFEGLVAAERVAEALGSAWAGLASVRPGRGYDFSFPTKMFVSTACGTPVIYAGVGPGREVVGRHALGWGADWDVSAVADAMRQALAGAPTPDHRARLAAWTAAHASQTSVAGKAAAAVLSAAREA